MEEIIFEVLPMTTTSYDEINEIISTNEHAWVFFVQKNLDA